MQVAGGGPATTPHRPSHIEEIVTSRNEKQQKSAGAYEILDEPGPILAEAAGKQQPHRAEDEAGQQEHHHAQAHAHLHSWSSFALVCIFHVLA